MADSEAKNRGGDKPDRSATGASDDESAPIDGRPNLGSDTRQRGKEKPAASGTRRAAERPALTDDDAEKSLLGAMILSQEALKMAVQNGITDEMLYDVRHRAAWRACHEFYAAGKPVDVVLLAHALHGQEEFSGISAAAFLNQIMETVPHVEHVDYYARIVREMHLRRLTEMHAIALHRLAHRRASGFVDGLRTIVAELIRIGKAAADRAK